jgi:HK97 family phage major capsid protein
MSEAARYAKKNYGEGSEVTKALAAGDFAAGGAIVPPDFVEDIIELLVSATVIRQMNPVTAPMPNGSLTLPKLTGGATASYIGENDDIPESQQTFGDVKLVFRKLVSLVPISNDLSALAAPPVMQSFVTILLAR